MNKSSIFLLSSLLTVLLLSTAHAVSADVLINEIAWMGTTNSANAEWMELYNNGTDSVPLDGWSLSAADGSPNIQLSGTISPQGYYLLERTSDDTVPGITADQIYSGSLGNSGEHLQLKDNLNNLVDDVDASGGWPAGDNTTKMTMQRSGDGWITAVGTPDAANATVAAVSATTTSTVSSSPSTTSSGTASDSSSDTGSSTTSTVTAPSSDDDSADDVVIVKPDPKYSATVVAPELATAGTPVSFSVIVKENGKRDMMSGKFQWYMGDGGSHYFEQNTDFNHVFYYPGTYVVTLEYYSSYFKTEPDSIHKKTIIIAPADVSITQLSDDGGVVFSNTSSEDIDLGGWKIVSGTNTFLFPRYTIVPKNGTLSVSSHVLGFSIAAGDRAILINSNGATVAAY
jgi:hypothetical protein